MLSRVGSPFVNSLAKINPVVEDAVQYPFVKWTTCVEYAGGF